ncbi:MAG TPA: tetratricopeptide repeat protein, partial [Woeseiaceae bacterium]|nr:tetratricopeptide repeat protein [Woeseiaceae bacterium]
MSRSTFLEITFLIVALAPVASGVAQDSPPDPKDDEAIQAIVFPEDVTAVEQDAESATQEEKTTAIEQPAGDDTPGVADGSGDSMDPGSNESGEVSDFRKEDLDYGYDEPVSEYATEEERDKAELVQSFELYKSSIENGMYEEADTLAKRIIELSIKLYGINSHDSAKALTNLGTVQYHNKDFDSAQLNYQAAIDIIERIEDRLHAGLINPLKGLGAAQLGAGRPDLAKETFDRAVHISHVNEGPHNLQQVDMLDALTETYLTVGEVDEALDVQEKVVNLQLRNVDLDSEAAIPALEREAQWMHRMQRYNAERNSYRKIIRILEKSRGSDDIALIPPLTGLGKSYLFVEPYDPELQYYTPASGGEVYLKRALRIAEESPQSDWEILRGSMLALGDFYTLSGRESRATRAYTEVWEYLSADAERIPSRVRDLESTVVLQDISPTLYYNSARQDNAATPPENFERGTIVVGYAIDTSGQAQNIRLIEARPPGLVEMQDEVMREVRDLIHRPRLENGNVVPVDGLTYTHEFYY